MDDGERGVSHIPTNTTLTTSNLSITENQTGVNGRQSQQLDLQSLPAETLRVCLDTAMKDMQEVLTWNERNGKNNYVYVSHQFEESAAKIGYGTLSDVDARRWFLECEAEIPKLVNSGLPLAQQAMQAVTLRNQARLQARLLMANQELARQLMEDG